MQNLIRKLPIEIVQKIIPYTYNLQNKDLLEDIVNYKNTRNIIDKIYYEYWINLVESEEPNDKYWMINNIFAYTNDYKPTMNGYVEKFYRIFYRNPQLHNISEVNEYLEKLELKPVITQINVFWGLLTPIERNDIINDFPQIPFFSTVFQ
jgi:hypothetical protein